MLLDAASHTPSPWLGPWTVLAAATGARNGELCGLEWADLELDAGTIRFRQALTIIDPAVLPDAADPGADARNSRSGRSSPLPAARCSPCRRSPSRRSASTAASRPASASPAGGPDGNASKGRTRPAAPAGPAGPGVPHRAGHAGQPQPRQPRLRPPRRQRRAGGPSSHAAACPGLGHGGQQGAGQHHRRPAASCRRRRPRPAGLHPPAPPDRAPGGRGDRGRVRPSSAGWAGGVGGASGGAERGNPTLEPRLTPRLRAAFPQLKGSVAGTGFEPV